MKLYPNERKAVRIIAKFQDKAKFRFTLDEYADRHYAEKERPPSWRSTVAQMLRRLGEKLEEDGTECRLIRSSGIGRGKIASYQTRGYFKSIDL